MVEQEPEGKQKRYSIFWILVILMVVVGVVPLFFYSQRTLDISKGYIENSLRENQLGTNSTLATSIQATINQFYQHLSDIKTSFELYSNDSNASGVYENLLARGVLSRNVSNECLMLFYRDKSGNQMSAAWQELTPQEEGALLEQVQSLSLKALESPDKNLAPEVFSIKVQAARGMATPAIIYTVPVRSSSSTIASITGIFLLEKLQTSLIQFGQPYGMFVTDEKGRLIFHSDATLAGQTLADFSKDPTVERALSAGYPISSMSIYVSSTYEDKERMLLVTYTPLQGQGYNWILYSQVDRDQYFATVRDLEEQSRLLIAAIIIISLCICFFFARLITKPILDITQVSRRLAAGDFDSRANERVRNEVGELARTFNKMAVEIQRQIVEIQAKAKENEVLFMDSIRAIANALDAKDPYTKGHSERVAAYALLVAREYGLDERTIQKINIASLLHDVGKIGIEDKILRKPGALTNDEFTQMKTHPSKGADILADIQQMAEMIPGIRHHHEKWGGGGYPSSLRNEQIPLIARIIGVADAFDAMTTNRPYQRAMDFDVAAHRVNELVMTVYDPRIVEAFNRAYQKGVFFKYRTTEQQAQSAPRPT